MGSAGFLFLFYFYLPRRAPNRLGKYDIYRDDGSEAVVVARLGKPIPTASENDFCSSASTTHPYANPIMSSS